MLFRVVKSDVVRGCAGIENSAEPLCPLQKSSCIVQKYNCLWAFYLCIGINESLCYEGPQKLKACYPQHCIIINVQ